MQDINALKQAAVAAQKAMDDALDAVKDQKRIDRIVNEGGEGYSLYDDLCSRIFDEHMPRIKAADAALFAAVWTPEVTAERRALWNAEIQKLFDAKVRVNHTVIAPLQQRLGFTMADLKKALGK